MLEKITKKSNLIFIFLVILFTVPAVVGLLHLGFPQTDDGNWMVIRFSAFYENLRAGQFPVRFLTRLNFNYGYPVSDFLYPLFMYLGVPFHVIGVSFVNTIKLLLIFSLFSSALFSFFWLRKIFDNVSSLVGSLLYVFFPYHLFDVYVRGSMGEALSLSLLPFVLWQIERKSLIFASLGIGLLVTAHNTLAFLFLPLIFFYGILRERKVSKFNITTLFLGILSSSFFWIPAIFDSRFTVFSKISVSDFSSYFINNNLGLLGVIFAFLIAESIFYLFRKRDKLFLCLFIALLLFCFLTLSKSLFFWNVLPFTNLIQFPFRIISLIIPLSAFVLAYLLNKEKSVKKSLLVIIYVVLIFISAVPFLSAENYDNYPDTFYSTNLDSTTVKNEYMPTWVKKIPSTQAERKVVNLSGKEEVIMHAANVNKISFSTNLAKDETIQINTVYFPGWSAYVNGKKVDISYDNNQGVIRLKLFKGENNVVVNFSETPVRIIADVLSIIGIVLIFCFPFINKKLKFKI